MSHVPFSIPPLPMTAERARDIARAYQGFANNLSEIGGPAIDIRLAERQSQWWLTYSLALAQANRPSPD